MRKIVHVAALATALLSGCATTANPRDPLESFNRDMFGFNEDLDTAVIKPVSETYRDYVPGLVRDGVRNFFSNLNDLTVFVNDSLQLKWRGAFDDLSRLVINSTIGIGGLMDPATKFGIEKRNEDFGQTLGFWGAPAGPYIVLPLLGPSTFPRDTVGVVADSFVSGAPLYAIDDSDARTYVGLGLGALRAVQVRSDLLDTGSLLGTAALDPYVFVRDAYLQRRENLVRDGALEKLEDPEDEPSSGSK